MWSLHHRGHELGGRAAQLLGEPVAHERELMFAMKQCSGCGQDFELLRYACPRCGSPLASPPSGDALEFMNRHQQRAGELVDRGAKLFKRGDLAEAEAEFHEAIEVNPWNATAHANIGLIKLREDAIDEAFRWWEKALEIDPDVAGVAEVMERNRARLTPRKQSATAAGPTAPAAAASWSQEISRASAAMFAQDWESAIRHYGAAISLMDEDNPMLVLVYGERGNAHAHNGDYRSACDAYDEALKRDPANAHYLDQRGTVYYRLGRYALAVQDYTRALSKLPSSGDETAAVLTRRAAAKIERSQRQAALADLRDADAMCSDQTLRQRIEELTHEVNERASSARTH